MIIIIIIIVLILIMIIMIMIMIRIRILKQNKKYTTTEHRFIYIHGYIETFLLFYLISMFIYFSYVFRFRQSASLKYRIIFLLKYWRWREPITVRRANRWVRLPWLQRANFKQRKISITPWNIYKYVHSKHKSINAC